VLDQLRSPRIDEAGREAFGQPDRPVGLTE
jgi:hypothetical protein